MYPFVLRLFNQIMKMNEYDQRKKIKIKIKRNRYTINYCDFQKHINEVGCG